MRRKGTHLEEIPNILYLVWLGGEVDTQTNGESLSPLRVQYTLAVRAGMGLKREH
jgi:hypothetical protein